MAATTYTDPKEYLKFLKDKCHEHDHSHTPCDGCNGDEKCSCCPPGLIAIFDDEGNHTGCVSANDAELYKKNTFTCQDGYVKLFKESDGTFLGCVTESEFATLYPIVNPPA